MLGAALAAAAELEGLGGAGEHPGTVSGEATGCAGLISTNHKLLHLMPWYRLMNVTMP
jgi:hypothetical protein